MGGRINGDVERLPADTERRLEELERAASTASTVR
jgi:hypothetical protein